MSAHLVHRELRNETFEGGKHKPKFEFRTLVTGHRLFIWESERERVKYPCVNAFKRKWLTRRGGGCLHTFFRPSICQAGSVTNDGNSIQARPKCAAKCKQASRGIPKTNSSGHPPPRFTPLNVVLHPVPRVHCTFDAADDDDRRGRGEGRLLSTPSSESLHKEGREDQTSFF